MKIISVASGKGGVGKTTVVCQLALSLAARNQRVLILDGDLGMSNVDIFFGVRPEKNILDILKGDNLTDCIVKLFKNVDLLAGGSGLHELVSTNAFQRRELIQQIESVSFMYDYVLIDTAPGLHDYVLHLNSVSDQCLLLITQDPTSFADAYALVKVMHQKHRTKSFQVICNQISDVKGELLFEKFSDIVEKFLNIRLGYLGSIEKQEELMSTVLAQRLNLKQHTKREQPPEAHSSFKELTEDLLRKLRQNDVEQNSAKGLSALFYPVSGHA